MTLADFDLEEWNNLGNVLLRHRAITSSQLKRLLDIQKKRRTQRLGELAVELAMCSREDVDRALQEQELHKLPPESESALQAKQILATAMASISQEADRLTAASKRRVLSFPISPLEN